MWPFPFILYPLRCGLVLLRRWLKVGPVFQRQQSLQRCCHVSIARTVSNPRKGTQSLAGGLVAHSAIIFYQHQKTMICWRFLMAISFRVSLKHTVIFQQQHQLVKSITIHSNIKLRFIFCQFIIMVGCQVQLEFFLPLAVSATVKVALA